MMYMTENFSFKKILKRRIFASKIDPCGMLAMFNCVVILGNDLYQR